MPIPLAIIAVAAAMAALAGGYWDDAWHTERGRDDFLIAPHIAIYSGIALVGAALMAWGLVAVRAVGVGVALSHGPLRLSVVSVAVTLASGGIDNAWHEAFGRDAVIWSPPHMLGIAGSVALGLALLAELAGRAGITRSLVGALLLSAAVFVVVEYDTDVPQFAVLWYLPVLTFASVFAFSSVRLAIGRKWAATEAALLHLLFVGLVSGLLVSLSFQPPALPLLLAAALVVDISGQRGWGRIPSAVLTVLAIAVPYGVGRNWLGEGIEFTLEDLLLGIPLSMIAAGAIYLLLRPRPPAPRRGSPVLAALVAIMLFPAAALAHDPGQGTDAGVLALSVRTTEQVVLVTGRIPEQHCHSTAPLGLTARRAGETLRAPLDKAGCEFEGRIQLDTRGRWFVYVEFRRGADRVEAWLPVEVGRGRVRVADLSRFAYVPPRSQGSALKVIIGGLLYLVLAALLMFGTRVLTRQVRGSPRE